MPDPTTMSSWRALAIEEVRRAHTDVRQADEAVRLARTRLHERAKNARSMGLTFAEIGEAMGVSRQRVHGMLQ
jgi:hypothetical protein